MTNIVIVGALGRVGREIGSAVLADSAVNLTGCIEVRGHPGIGSDYGVLIGQGAIGLKVVDDIAAAPVETSVIINFSTADAIDQFMAGLAGRQTRLVLGTTGLSEATHAALARAARTIPLVVSPNMSLGVNILFHLAELVASRLKDDFDIEIIEAHHRLKKDSPSGTARKLGEIAAAALDVPYDAAVKNGRAGLVGERGRNEIGMHAVRGGDIVGDHTVLFAGSGERLELRHQAHSRATFAKGAVAAAKWLAARGPGLYSMQDVLGLERL